MVEIIWLVLKDNYDDDNIDNISSLDEDDDFVDRQRMEVLRNNDKFMKELQKKYEEIKKAKI